MDERNGSSGPVLINSISISNTQKQILLNHTQKLDPNESCAILYGKIKKNHAEVKEIFLADNIDKSSTNFTISNKQLIKAYKKAQDCNMEIVGIFHSHPRSGAIPSSTDKKFMEINPVVWIIYSALDQNFKAYILEQKIQQVKILD